MNCTAKEQETCQVEKLGCNGCAYNRENKEVKDEEKDGNMERYKELRK